MIGPDIPTQLLQNRSTTPEEEAGPSEHSIGPAIPPEILARSSAPTSVHQQQEEEEEEDDYYAPALPPDLLAARSGPSNAAPAASSSKPKPVVGPTFPSSLANRYDRYHEDEESDEDVGPMPLPEGVVLEEKDGVQEFLEKEERRRKQIEVCRLSLLCIWFFLGVDVHAGSIQFQVWHSYHASFRPLHHCSHRRNILSISTLMC